MNYDQYVEAMNDPRRRIGPWGPLSGAATYCIVDDSATVNRSLTTLDRRPSANGKPIGTPPQVSRSQAARDDVVTFRLEQHRKAAEADKVVARLRRLR